VSARLVADQIGREADIAAVSHDPVDIEADERPETVNRGRRLAAGALGRLFSVPVHAVLGIYY
jgi:hypothetical protein